MKQTATQGAKRREKQAAQRIADESVRLQRHRERHGWGRKQSSGHTAAAAKSSSGQTAVAAKGMDRRSSQRRRGSNRRSSREAERVQVAEEADQVIKEMVAAEQRVNSNKASGQATRAGEGAIEGGTESASEDQKHEQRTRASTRSKPRAAEGKQQKQVEQKRVAAEGANSSRGDGASSSRCE